MRNWPKWRRDAYGRKTVQGYLDMGRIRIPPVTDGVVLTDRNDATEYLLSHDGTPDPSLVAAPANFRGVTYAAQAEGPLVVDDNNVVLLVYVDSGTLLTEEAPARLQGRRPPPIMTRDYSDATTTYKLLADLTLEDIAST